MAHMTPPLPPRTTYGDLPGRHIDFRLWQIVMSAATIVLAGWFFTLNPIAGIVASFFAKHVLVAILAAGLDHPSEAQASSPEISDLPGGTSSSASPSGAS